MLPGVASKMGLMYDGVNITFMHSSTQSFIGGFLICDKS